MRPLVERDNYGVVPPAADVTAPDLKQAYFTTNTRNEIALVFGQTMNWNTTAKTNFYLDRGANQVTAGSASGNVVKLQLTGPSTNQTIGYVLSSAWDGLTANLLYGSNGVAALTFYGVPIAPPTPATLTATAGAGQVALSWAASAGAAGYQIKRAQTSGGPYTVIGSATGTSFTDSTAANGTTYRYVVSATISVGDRVGESPDSTEASATPAGTFESWIGGYYTTPGDPRRDSGADPDHDGLSNFHEFAFGLDPAVGSSANPCTPLRGTQFSYTKRADSGLSYTVEYSTNLTNMESGHGERVGRRRGFQRDADGDRHGQQPGAQRQTVCAGPGAMKTTQPSVSDQRPVGTSGPLVPLPPAAETSHARLMLRALAPPVRADKSADRGRSALPIFPATKSIPCIH